MINLFTLIIYNIDCDGVKQKITLDIVIFSMNSVVVRHGFKK